MFSQIFIRRPILATVCSLIIMLAGAVAIPSLPIARYPELTPPAVSVSAFYTGANAQAVESAVTTPLEQVINGVEGMLYMTSSSTNSGFASINVIFEIGGPYLAAVDGHMRESGTRRMLPMSAERYRPSPRTPPCFSRRTALSPGQPRRFTVPQQLSGRSFGIR